MAKSQVIIIEDKDIPKVLELLRFAKKKGCKEVILSIQKEEITEEITDIRMSVDSEIMPFYVNDYGTVKTIPQRLKCAASDCGKEFVPVNRSHKQRYCSIRCQNREYMRSYKRRKENLTL